MIELQPIQIMNVVTATFLLSNLVRYILSCSVGQNVNPRESNKIPWLLAVHVGIYIFSEELILCCADIVHFPSFLAQFSAHFKGTSP